MSREVKVCVSSLDGKYICSLYIEGERISSSPPFDSLEEAKESARDVMKSVVEIVNPKLCHIEEQDLSSGETIVIDKETEH